ncbi:MAG: murein hydrolase activator EnvC family protein [Pseudanabaenaceae cyanobacterium]
MPSSSHSNLNLSPIGSQISSQATSQPVTSPTKGTPKFSVGVLQQWRSVAWVWLGGLMVVIIVIVLVWHHQPIASAQSLQELEQYRNQMEQQKELIQLQRSQIQMLTKPAEDRLNTLRKTVKVTDQQIRDNEKKLQNARAELQKLATQLQTVENRLTQKRIATVARLRYMQRQQLQRWWVLLLSSRDLNQFADRRHRINRIYEADRQLLANFKQAFDQVDQQRNRMLAQSNEIELLNQKLKYQKANYEAQAVAQGDIVKRLKQDRRALEIAEDRLAEDSRRLSQLIVAKSRAYPGGVLPQLGTGKFIYPAIGPITSEFGWRTHPILGYERFHAGMDIGADHGELIYAADAGTVIFSDWYGGYGNSVIIDHGNGLTTLYAHASEVYVQEGQGVTKGQPIAAIGSTGFSTGPHLHFEVRKDGEPIDPAQFL